MTSMTSPTTRIVIGGVDTHGHTHHAAVIDEVGRQLGDREFTATPAGYRALAAWLGKHGTVTTIAGVTSVLERRRDTAATSSNVRPIIASPELTAYPCELLGVVSRSFLQATHAGVGAAFAERFCMRSAMNMTTTAIPTPMNVKSTRRPSAA